MIKVPCLCIAKETLSLTTSWPMLVFSVFCFEVITKTRRWVYYFFGISVQWMTESVL